MNSNAALRFFKNWDGPFVNQPDIDGIRKRHELRQQPQTESVAPAHNIRWYVVAARGDTLSHALNAKLRMRDEEKHQRKHEPRFFRFRSEAEKSSTRKRRFDGKADVLTDQTSSPA